jgi:MinD superfamily P-loop ATPase
LEGATVIETKVGLTVRVVDPVTPETVAVIVADPAATALADPGLAWPVVWTVAVAVDDELQLAEVVRF